MKPLAALVLAALLVVGSAGADPRFAGTWLAESDAIDLAIEAGLDVPSHPVLVLDGDGGFRLYHLQGACIPLDAAGEFVDGEAACTAQRDASRADLGHAHARLHARGSWRAQGPARPSADGSGLLLTVVFETVFRQAPETRLAGELARFAAEPLQPADVPPEWRDRIEAYRAAAAQGARDLWSPPWLEPGIQATMLRAGDVLVVIAAGSPRPSGFVRRTPRALSDTALLLNGVEASYARYFRCALAAVAAASAATQPDASARDLLAFIGLAGEVEAGRAPATMLRDTALVRAAHGDTRALGAALGCPERDRLWFD